VLVTTPEVFEGTQEQFHSLSYNDHDPGRAPQSGAKLRPRAPMREALRELLPPQWAPIAKGRTEVPLYWCLVDRTALLPTFQRVAEMLLAVRATGALGKEVWINLTGGNNVINLALQLAATLTGQPARFYYVQAADRAEESCLRYPCEEGYWVDLPLLPVPTSRGFGGFGIGDFGSWIEGRGPRLRGGGGQSAIRNPKPAMGTPVPTRRPSQSA